VRHEYTWYWPAWAVLIGLAARVVRLMARAAASGRRRLVGRTRLVWRAAASRRTGLVAGRLGFRIRSIVHMSIAGHT